jgi:hypothetical protein
MLIQIFAVVFVLFGVTVALMCRQLPEHRQIAGGFIESPRIASEPATGIYVSPCEDGKVRRGCPAATAPMQWDIDDDRQEEPDLD